MMGDGTTSVEICDPRLDAEDQAFISRCLNRHLGPKSRLVKVWQVLVVLSIVVDVFVDTFLWSFDSRIREMWFIVYAMDVIFIVNIAVKFFTAYYDKGILITDSKKIRRHYLKSTFAVDMLTIVPLELAALSPALLSMKYVAVLRSNRLIRLYAVFSYFHTLESHLGTNVKRLLLCKYFTIASLLIHLLACAWYAIGCPGKHDGLDMTCRPESWAMTFNFGHDLEIETASTGRSYILSLYWAVTTATSTGYGDLRPILIGEKWFGIVSMLMGIVVFFGVILGGMASYLTNLDTERAEFTHRLNVIKKQLRNSGIPKELGKKALMYYKYLWYRTKGVTKQGLLKKLPVAFHAEVSHSANRYILDQAKMFENLNPGFLRMLSMVMKPVFYLPGQIIVDHNNITNCMFFVQRGELEIMDPTYQWTAVDKMKSGQLFGEVSLVRTIPRSNDIRAAAHCDIMQLDRADLNSVLIHYPGIHQHLIAVADGRIAKAVELAQSEISHTAIQIEEDIDIETDNDAPAPSATSEVEPERPSKFRKWVEDLKKFDWYFLPNSKFVRFWEFLIFFVTLAIGFLYPYATSFLANLHERGSRTTTIAEAIMITFDLIVIFDIILRLRIAHVTPNGTYRDFKSVYDNYIRTWAFVLDVLAALTLQIFSLLYPQGAERVAMVYMLSLNRLIKVWRLNHFFTKKEEDLDIPIGLLRFGKFVLYIGLYTHWCACLWYYTLHAQGREGFQESAHDDHSGEGSSSMEYLIAVYWTATTMTSTGYGDITPHSQQTYLTSVGTMIGGLLLFGFILACVAAILTNLDMYRVKYLEHLSAVKIFMKDHALSPAIQRRVINEKNIGFKQNEGVCVPGGTRLMHDMPQTLQEELAFFETHKLFQKVPLFTDCDEAFLRQLALKTERYIYSPGEKIITKGDKGRELYLIKKGRCEVLTQDQKRAITSLGPGDFVGELAFMFGGERTTTVEAVSHVDVLMLKHTDLDEVLQDFPLIRYQIADIEGNESYREELQSVICDCEDEIYASTRPKTIGDLMNEDKFQGHDKTHHYTNTKKHSVKRFDELEGVEKEIHMEPYKNLDRFARFMTKFLLNMTIKPDGFNAQFWEGSRVIIALAMAFCYLFLAAFLHMNPHLWVVSYVFDLICLVDVYIHFHWAYYSEEGLLITHPLATAKHYIRNTFVVDLIACLPIELLVYAAIQTWTPEAIHMYAVLRFNRMIQLYRVPLSFNYLEGNIHINTGIVKEVKFFFYLLLFFHTLSCIWFIQACPPVGFSGLDDTTLVQDGILHVAGGVHYCQNSTWVMRFDNFVDMAPMQMYVVSLYWASATGASVGYGDIYATPDNITEMNIAIFAMTCGILYFGYIIASVAASMANADSQRASFQEKIVASTSYLGEKKVDMDLKTRISNYFRYIWLRTKGIDPDTLFDGLTLTLKADVSMALYKDIIEAVPLFQGTGENFIKTLASCIKPVYYMANEYVVRKFDHGENMFFIHRGCVDVVSEDGKIVFDTMKPGRFFGEISLIMSCPRTASIRAQTNCDMFVLQKEDLDQVLLGYPSIKKQILEVAQERIAAVRKRSAAKVEVKKEEPQASPAPATSTASVASSSSTSPAATAPVVTAPVVTAPVVSAPVVSAPVMPSNTSATPEASASQAVTTKAEIHRQQPASEDDKTQTTSDSSTAAPSQTDAEPEPPVEPKTSSVQNLVKLFEQDKPKSKEILVQPKGSKVRDIVSAIEDGKASTATATSSSQTKVITAETQPAVRPKTPQVEAEQYVTRILVQPCPIVTMEDLVPPEEEQAILDAAEAEDNANNNAKDKAKKKKKKKKKDSRIQMDIDDQGVVVTRSGVPSLLRRLQAANRIVIDPSSPRLQILSNIICVLIVFTSMTTIFQAAFQYNSAWVLVFTYLFELVFIFEIYVKFHVTRADEYGELEMDFHNVYKLYLRNPGGFALDMIPTVPLEIIAAFLPVSYRFAAFSYLRLTRLIRLIRIDHFFSSWERQLDINMLRVRLTKMLVFVMLIIHFCACIWYLIACPAGKCKDKSWTQFQGYLSDEVVSIGARFTDSIYWCVATITSTGYGDITAHSFEEMLFASFTMILGQLLVGTVLGNIASTLANEDTQRVNYEKDLNHLKDQMDEDNVDATLKESVVDYFDYLWLRNKGVDQLDLFQTLPLCMRTELALHIYGSYLRKVRLFADCSEAFFRDLSLSIHEVILRPGDDIVDEGDIAEEMYIIYKGQVKVESDRDPSAVGRILHEGDYFDDINLLYDVPRSHTMKAFTQVDAITISMDDLNGTMERFPDDAIKIRETGESIFAAMNATAEAAEEQPAASANAC